LFKEEFKADNFTAKNGGKYDHSSEDYIDKDLDNDDI
jgi:hypothetical protein